MDKQTIINLCENSGIGYKIAGNKLFVSDLTQLPGGVRSQFDAHGVLIEAVMETPVTQPVVDETPPIKKVKK